MMWIIDHAKHIYTPEINKFQNGVRFTIENGQFDFFGSFFLHAGQKIGLVPSIDFR